MEVGPLSEGQQYRYERMRRHLNSHCKGLLEVPVQVFGEDREEMDGTSKNMNQDETAGSSGEGESSAAAARAQGLAAAIKLSRIEHCRFR